MAHEILNSIINYSSSFKADSINDFAAITIKDMIAPGLTHYLLLALALFALGIFMVINSENLIKILIGIEFMLNAACINFVAFNAYVVHHNAAGQAFSLIILAIGAISVAVALAIICAIFNQTKNICTKNLDKLKGDGA